MSKPFYHKMTQDNNKPANTTDDALNQADTCLHCSGDGCTAGCEDNCHCKGRDFCKWGDSNLRGLPANGCGRSDHQLNSYDYLADVPGNVDTTDFVEVSIFSIQDMIWYNLFFFYYADC